MKKILLPLEDTERSLKALHYTRKHYPPSDAELVLMMVDERLGYSVKSEAETQALKELDEKLELIIQTLEDYKVSTVSAVGKAGIRITRTAREIGADLIVMTKSSKADMLSSIGTTTEYVINNAPCDVVIISEAANSRNEYRGLVYRTANGLVNLRGQLGDKQSECLLPSVNQDCIYHIDVTVGKIRFFHTAYNPDTRNWDLPPKPGQEVTLDIAAGESKDILVMADSTDGKADRIRIVNRDMKKEAVFSFNITAAEKDENGVTKSPEQEEAKEEIKETLASRDTIEIPKANKEPEPEVKFDEPAPASFAYEDKPADAPSDDAPAVEEEPEAKHSVFGKLFGSK
ncbi:MAG: universal stress protein [Mogibacterium sp.]|nr:universal stress protein [Mogibacterium sp.]